VLSALLPELGPFIPPPFPPPARLSSLLSVPQVIIQKLSASERTKAGAVQYADQMMALFLRVFACRSATVHEEAMMAIGALAYATGKWSCFLLAPCLMPQVSGSPCLPNACLMPLVRGPVSAWMLGVCYW